MGRLAWGIWASYLLVYSVGALLAFLARADPADSATLLPPFSRILLYLPTLFAFPTIGALIATRHPRNPIGWLFLSIGLVGAFGIFAESYWRYALFVRPGALPGGLLMLWVNVRPYSISNGVLFILLILLFPTGRPPSRRWWIVGWLIILGGLIHQGALAFLPGPLDPSVTITNPVGMPDATPFLQVSANLGVSLQVLGVLGAALSLIVRFRRAHGVERQQIKWLASALALYAATGAPLLILTTPLGQPSLIVNLFFIASAFAGVVVAGAAGIAILRHHLFDIDLIIRRTVVYAVVTALLGALYVGAVVALQALFERLSGQESALAVVASTLAIAALFGPLRVRVQRLIDRRFDRTRYDARLVLAQFAARAQQEADLDTLSADLLATVDEALKPSEVRLWLVQRERRTP